MLTDLIVSHTHLIPFPSLRWANFRSISLDSCACNIVDLLEAIRLAGNSLNHLSIYHQNPRDRRVFFATAHVSESRPPLPVNLPIVDLVALNALTLDFGDANSEDMHFVVAHLHTPRLQCFHIIRPDDNYLLSILAFARSCKVGTCLQTLTIDLPCFDAYGVFVEFLAELDALQTLSLLGEDPMGFTNEGIIPIGHVDATLKALEWPSAMPTLDVRPFVPAHHSHWSTPGICPRLTSITLQGLTLRLRLLERMVRSRRQEEAIHVSRSLSPSAMLEDVALRNASLGQKGVDLKWWKDMQDNNVITLSTCYSLLE